ncbi:MAG: hypothetical protein CL908_01360 [Deltaproteobacteria bacterium]|jgi:membrane protease YdiL (CAAX protease family)|nr:hypothetical protein [Deltaproteobacteria bacterium]
MPDRPLHARDGWLQVLGLVGASHLLENVARLLPGYAESRISELLAQAAATSGAPRLTLLVSSALIGPMFEELVFRGVLFELLRRWRGPGAAIVGSALLFGAAHLDTHQSGVAALLGLQLGALRHVHGLSWAIIAHVANNGLALGASAFALPAGLSASPTARLASIAAALCLTGFACASLAQSMRSPDPEWPAPAPKLQNGPEASE